MANTMMSIQRAVQLSVLLKGEPLHSNANYVSIGDTDCSDQSAEGGGEFAS